MSMAFSLRKKRNPASERGALKLVKMLVSNKKTLLSTYYCLFPTSYYLLSLVSRLSSLV